MAFSNVSRIPVFRNKNYVADGTKSLVSLFNKYGIAPTKPGRFHRNHENILMKRQDDGSSTVVTTDDQQNDVFYTCPIQIGTPPQTLDLNLDSGSADCWVWSTGLPAQVIAKGRAAGVVIYDPSKSSTFSKVTGSTFMIRYGDNSGAAGSVGRDNVKIGNITVQGQPIELAEQLSNQLQTQTGSHGLLGLAFGSINTVQPRPVRTPLENMILQQDIPADKKLFTCYLGSYKDAADPDKGQSFFTFGTIDDQVVQSTGQAIAYTPIDDADGFWKFSSPSVTINGQQISLPNNTAIADTGTTLLLTSDDVCQQIYSTIPGAVYDNDQQGWLFPENTSPDQLPVVSFAVGDKQIVIEKEQLGFSKVGNTGMWFGGIQSQGSIPFNIFGDVFLKCVYAVFDAGNKQFGVVQRADPTPDGIATQG